VTSHYFDSSALVKLYVPEKGSKWVLSILRAVGADGYPAHQLAFAKIGIVEVASALARLERQNEITVEKRRSLYASFMRDNQSRFRLLGLTDDILHLAARLTYRTVLRSYDAVHLAAALTLNQQLASAGLPPLIFITADDQLYEAAIHQGLAADNPNHHP